MVPKILHCLQNQASAQNARKILVGAGLLLLTYFYKCLHARFLVEEAFWQVLVARKANFCQCSCPGGVLRDQSDGDDRMEAKLRTQKIP